MPNASPIEPRPPVDRYLVLTAAGAAALSALVLAVDLRTEGPAHALLHGSPAIVIMVCAAIALQRFRRVWRDLQIRTKDLADVNFALDQSAIVATTDVRGAITYVNQKFCDISKYSRQELLGRDHRILNSAHHPKTFFRDLWVTIANGHIWRGEIRNRAKDGSLYWVDTTIVPFLDARGKPYQYMAIRYEITARKRSEQLLREQEALARLGQMAAVVAHEVKNPIAGIRGALQIIATRMPPGSRDRPIIGDIIARLDALNGIVQDLLVFARPRELRAQPVALRSLIDSTITLLRADPAFASVAIEVSGGDGQVIGDGEQLQLVFMNIFMNAAHAMNGVGMIRVKLEPLPNAWAVSIADEGTGMTAEVREKAFEPFFTTKHRGTGLGLPTAKRVIEAHHGHIDIHAGETGGTIVTIDLPAVAPGEQPLSH